MRKPFLFTLFLIILYTSLAAQSEKKPGGWAALLSPALIPISQPGLGIQPGISYQFNERYSVLAEITIPVNKKSSKDSSELDKKYFRVKTELRYSFLSGRKNSHWYAGLQVAGSARKFINQNGFYYDDRASDSGYYYSRAAINSPVTTFSIQFGTIITKKRLAADLFAGIGARFIKTDLTAIENPVRSFISKPASGLSFTPSYSYAGNIVMLHLTGGIRLIWYFYEFSHPQKNKSD